MKQNRFVPSNVKNNHKNQICPKLGLYVNYALTNPGRGRTADRNVRMIPLSCVSEAGSGASSGMRDPRLPLLADGVYPRYAPINYYFQGHTNLDITIPLSDLSNILFEQGRFEE